MVNPNDINCILLVDNVGILNAYTIPSNLPNGIGGRIVALTDKCIADIIDESYDLSRGIKMATDIYDAVLRGNTSVKPGSNSQYQGGRFLNTNHSSYWNPGDEIVPVIGSIEMVASTDPITPAATRTFSMEVIWEQVVVDAVGRLIGLGITYVHEPNRRIWYVSGATPMDVAVAVSMISILLEALHLYPLNKLRSAYTISSELDTKLQMEVAKIVNTLSLDPIEDNLAFNGPSTRARMGMRCLASADTNLLSRSFRNDGDTTSKSTFINSASSLPPSTIATNTTTPARRNLPIRSQTVPIAQRLPLPTPTTSSTPIVTVTFDPEEDEFLTINREFPEVGAVEWLMKGSDTKAPCSEVELNAIKFQERVRNKQISSILFVDSNTPLARLLSTVSLTDDAASIEAEKSRVIEQSGADGQCETLVDVVIDIFSFAERIIYNLYMCPKKFIDAFFKSLLVWNTFWEHEGSSVHFLIPRNIAEEVVPELEISVRMIMARLKVNNVADWKIPRITCNIVDVLFPAAHHTKAIYASHRDRQSLHLLSSSGNPSTFGYGWEIFRTRDKSLKVSIESSLLLSIPMDSDFGLEALEEIDARINAMLADGNFYEPSLKAIKDPIYTAEKKKKDDLIFKSLFADVVASTETEKDRDSMRVGVQSAKLRLGATQKSILKPIASLNFNPIALQPADVVARDAEIELEKGCSRAGEKVITFCFSCRAFFTEPTTTKNNPNFPLQSSVDHEGRADRAGGCRRTPRTGWDCTAVSWELYCSNRAVIHARFRDYKSTIETFAVPTLLAYNATSLWYRFYYELAGTCKRNTRYSVSEFTKIAWTWYLNNKEVLELHPESAAFYFLSISVLDQKSASRRGSILSYIFGPLIFVSDPNGFSAPEILLNTGILDKYLRCIFDGTESRLRFKRKPAGAEIEGEVGVRNESSDEDDGYDDYYDATVEEEGEMRQEMIDGAAN